MKNTYASVTEAIKEVKVGKMIIILDPPERENEGDLFIPAQFANPDIINTMLQHARGLICVPMTCQRLADLRLPLMVGESDNTERTKVNFAVSVNAKEDITTGISAYDRSRTIQLLADATATATNFTKPGHVFPLKAEDGGLFVREGHTEAAVAICRLADLEPIGVLCEILGKNGAMATKKELEDLGAKLSIKILYLPDLVEYVRKTQKKPDATNPIRLFSQARLPTAYGNFKIMVYYSHTDSKEHIALVKGKIENQENVLVRVHSSCLTGDALFSLRCDCGGQLQKSFEMISKIGNGIIIYLDQEGRGIGLSEKIKAYALQDTGLDTVEANLKLGHPIDSRDFSIAADILKDLQVQSIKLLTNYPDKIRQMKKYFGPFIVQVPLETVPVSSNKKYLKTKKEKMGHKLRLV